MTPKSVSSCNVGSIATAALLGREAVFVISEHDELKWNLDITDATGKLVLWLLGLSEPEIDLVYCAGIEELKTDALPLQNKKEPIKRQLKTISGYYRSSSPFIPNWRGNRYVHVR